MLALGDGVRNLSFLFRLNLILRPILLNNLMEGTQMALKDLITLNRRKPIRKQDDFRYPIAGLQREMSRLLDDFLSDFDEYRQLAFWRRELR